MSLIKPDASYIITVDAMGYSKGDFFKGLENDWLEHERTKQKLPVSESLLSKYFLEVKKEATLEEIRDKIESLTEKDESIASKYARESREVMYKAFRANAAMSAMQGLLANEDALNQLRDASRNMGTSLTDEVVMASIHYADALIARLKPLEEAKSK